MAKSKSNAGTPPAPPTQKIEDIDHQELTTQLLPERISSEATIKKEIEKFDVAKAWIDEKKSAFSLLKIDGLDDKVGEKAVHLLWQQVRDKRILVEKTRKERKDYFIKVGKGIDAYAKELTEALLEIEEPAKKLLEEQEFKREEKRMKAEREALERLHNRVSELQGAGMEFNGSFYCIGNTITVDVVTLKTLPDGPYLDLLEKVRAEAEVIRLAKAKAEEEAAAAAAAQEAQRIANEEEAKRLAAENERLAAERLALQKERTEARAMALEGLGFKFVFSSKEWVYATDDATCAVPESTVTEFDATAWKATFENLQKNVFELAAAQKAKDAETQALRLKAEQQKEIINQRKILLIDYYKMTAGVHVFIRRGSENVQGYSVSMMEIETDNPAAWEETLKELDAAKQRFSDQQEAEEKRITAENERLRQMALGDQGRAREYVLKFRELLRMPPTMESKEFIHLLNNFTGVIERGLEDFAILTGISDENNPGG